jgi:hypothetical protein
MKARESVISSADRPEELPPPDRSDCGGLDVNVPLIVARSLAIPGAALHGVGGEVGVVRRLSPGMLPSTLVGGPGE